MSRPSIHRYTKSNRNPMITLGLTCLALMLIASPLGQSSISLSRHTLRELATVIAHKQGLDPKLVRAVVTVESSWRPGARSSKDALGLMQVHHPTWRHKHTRRDLLDPELNLLAGTAILRKYMDESSTLKEALRKYSGGEPEYYEKVMRAKKGA
jgi:soluble lytic murein transglycosylase-like protein